MALPNDIYVIFGAAGTLAAVVGYFGFHAGVRSGVRAIASKNFFTPRVRPDNWPDRGDLMISKFEALDLSDEEAAFAVQLLANQSSIDPEKFVQVLENTAQRLRNYKTTPNEVTTRAREAAADFGD